MQSAQRGVGGVAVDRHADEVVEDDPQVGYPFRKGAEALEVVGAHQHIELEVAGGQQLHVGHEAAGFYLLEGAAGYPDSPEQGVGREKRSMSDCEPLPVGIDVPHQADDPGIGGGEVEHPLVVLQPGAGLDDDGSGHPLGDGELAVVLRQHGAVEESVAGSRPGHSLGAGGVVEVGVGIDDHRAAPCWSVSRSGSPTGC